MGTAEEYFERIYPDVELLDGKISSERLDLIKSVVLEADGEYPSFNVVADNGLEGGAICILPKRGALAEDSYAFGFIVQQGGALRGIKEATQGLYGLDELAELIDVINSEKNWTYAELTDLRPLNNLFSLKPHGGGLVAVYKSKEAIRKLEQFTKDELRAVVDVFRAQQDAQMARYADILDPEVFRVTNSVDELLPNIYDFYAKPGETGLRRQQAADAYPLMAGTFVEGLQHRFIIDNGRSLKQVLGTALGCSGGALKRLGKLRDEKGIPFVPQGLPALKLAKILTSIDGGWMPKSKQEWTAFCEVATAFEKHLAPLLKGDAQNLYKTAAGNWVAFNKSLRKAAELVDADGNVPEKAIGNGALVNFARGAHNVAQKCTDKLVYPLLWSTAFGGEMPTSTVEHESAMLDFAGELLFEGLTAKAIMEKLVRFQTNAAGLNNAGTDVAFQGALKTEWPALTEEITAPNGFKLTPLTTQEQLVVEGEEMENCVGTLGYDRLCYGALSAIYSVQDPNGDRSATLEIAIQQSKQCTKGMDGAYVAQLYAYDNTDACADADQATNWFMEQLYTGGVENNLKAIQDHSQLIRSEDLTGGFEVRCGYDGFDISLVERCHADWKPFFTKSQQKLDLDQRVEGDHFQALLGRTNPHADWAYNLERLQTANSDIIHN